MQVREKSETIACCHQFNARIKIVFNFRRTIQYDLKINAAGFEMEQAEL